MTTLSDAQLTDSLVAGMEDDKPDRFDLAKHYWLAYPEYSDDFAAAVVDRFTDFTAKWRQSSTPLGNAIWQAYRTFHGMVDGGEDPTVNLLEAGEQGEFLKLFINHFRGLVQHQIALVTADRPTWDVQARTASAAAAKQVSLGTNLLDFAMTAKGYEQKLVTAYEMSKPLASAFFVQGWDANAGYKAGGDVWCTALAPWEVTHEDVRDYADANWHIFVRWESRWDWAAHFADSDPELAERLISHSPGDDMFVTVNGTAEEEDKDADRIPLLYVYANPSRSCPLGRLAIVAGAEGDLVLQDGPMPYGKAPIRRICPAEFLGTSVPYGNSWSMLPIQEAYDVATSAMMSRIDMFGVPNVVSQDGVEFSAGDMGGANLIQVPPGTTLLPQALDMLTIPTPLPSFRDSARADMELLSGINSVTRGNPNENITSGSMAALVQSMAQQFNSSDERAWTLLLEGVATDLIRIYQKMATEVQMISIAGEDERYTAREFKAEDLDQIQRVTIKIGNALSRNIAGRMQIADTLLQNNLIQDPREYMEVLHTGNLSPVFSGPVNELTNIKAENEALLRGEEPVVMEWDNHGLHIREHKRIFDTEARNDEGLVQRGNTHLMGHMEKWSRMSREAPDMLAAIGLEPLPMAAMAGQMAMQAEGAPPGAPQAGPPPQKTPGAAETKSKPGPAPAPKGHEQPMAAPNLPSPSRSPVQ